MSANCEVKVLLPLWLCNRAEFMFKSNSKVYDATTPECRSIQCATAPEINRGKTSAAQNFQQKKKPNRYGIYNLV